MRVWCTLERSRGLSHRACDSRPVLWRWWCSLVSLEQSSETVRTVLEAAPPFCSVASAPLSRAEAARAVLVTDSSVV